MMKRNKSIDVNLMAIVVASWRQDSLVQKANQGESPKPSAFESEIHPSHKTSFYAPGIFRAAAGLGTHKPSKEGLAPSKDVAIRAKRS